jgi:hypothetical protein
MALIGNCTHTKYELNGEKEYVVVEQPDGTMKEELQDVPTATETEYNNVYVIIKQVEFFQTYKDQKAADEEDSNFVKTQAVLYQIAGYESKEERDKNQENWLFWDGLQLEDYDYSKNLLEQCYNEFNNKEGYTNLIND